ncbi:hypothetical protein [Streptomyces sp. NPDC053560]|uniref:hypothetical protein n=1 Tax=Streptomyces sp. NPDC053560 TaxID=3365711 RepID=UPI0037D6BC8A
MRLAAVLLLIGSLFGATAVTAHAAPVGNSASRAVQAPMLGSGGKGSGGSSGGVSKSGSRTSKSGGFSSSRGYGGSSSSGHGNMPLWQAILVLLLFGGLAVWGLVKLVQKVRKALA